MEAHQNLTPGYRLNAETIQRDLYQLTTMLLAFIPIEKASDPISDLQAKFADHEISRLLLTTAIANRVQREHMQSLRSDPAESSYELVEGNCGEWDWSKDHFGKKPTPLKFKDTCDKIIHAAEIGTISFDPPSLHLAGTHYNKRFLAVDHG